MGNDFIKTVIHTIKHWYIPLIIVSKKTPYFSKNQVLK